MTKLMQGVQDTETLREIMDIADSHALEELVRRGKPPSWKKKQSFSRAPSDGHNGDTPKPYSPAVRAQASSGQKAKQFGSLDTASIAMGGAGQGGGLGLNRPGAGPTVKHFAGGGRGSISQELQMDDEIGQAWIQVQDQNDPMGWVFCTYSADGKKLELKAKGGGGLKAFKAELGDELGWAAFRCYGVDKRGGLECKRPKFVNVQYKPEAASSIKKARMGSNKGAVKDVLKGTHLDIIVENLNDLAEATLIEKLQAATGAHKPNGYEFDDGVFCEADFYGLGIGKDCKGEGSKNMN
jgi:hypothetical protein